jgi:hypothetical protein
MELGEWYRLRRVLVARMRKQQARPFIFARLATNHSLQQYLSGTD